MVLQDAVAINYGVYTLFCRRVMENIQALERALEGDLDLPLDECLRRFSVWLKEFFYDVTPTVSEDTIRLFCQTVTARVNIMRTGEGRAGAAAAIFEQVVSEAHGHAPLWAFLPEITSYHDQGRELAQAFFNNLSNSVTPDQLVKMAELDVSFSGSVISDQSACGNLGLGKSVSPMVTLPKENKIILRFTYEHGFHVYLLYLFLFLHEYTGHIFSNDYGNRLISDGWMIFAADEFLSERWDNPALKREQAFAFRRYFLEKVGGVPREGYDFAALFCRWLGMDCGVLSFQAITYELATFIPQPGEKKWWPTNFFYALRNELYRDKEALRSKIKSARDIRHLYSMLPPPKALPY